MLILMLMLLVGILLPTTLVLKMTAVLEVFPSVTAATMLTARLSLS